MIRNAPSACAIGLASPGRRPGSIWRGEVSGCEPSFGRLIARHLQCRADPVAALCGKIRALRADLGGLTRFQVLWLTGTGAQVLIGLHEDQLSIMASRLPEHRQ
jgi:hypothetical protein